MFFMILFFTYFKFFNNFIFIILCFICNNNFTTTCNCRINSKIICMISHNFNNKAAMM